MCGGWAWPTCGHRVGSRKRKGDWREETRSASDLGLPAPVTPPVARVPGNRGTDIILEDGYEEDGVPATQAMQDGWYSGSDEPLSPISITLTLESPNNELMTVTATA